MRNYGEVPPWLNTDPAPQISATSGLGTGGGAGVATQDGTGFGDVLVYAGNGWTVSGSVALTFASAPPILFIGADQDFGPVTQATVGNVVTISWTAANFIPGSKPHRLHYEWSVSQ